MWWLIQPKLVIFGPQTANHLLFNGDPSWIDLSGSIRPRAAAVSPICVLSCVTLDPACEVCPNSLRSRGQFFFVVIPIALVSLTPTDFGELRRSFGLVKTSRQLEGCGQYPFSMANLRMSKPANYSSLSGHACNVLFLWKEGKQRSPFSSPI